MFEESLTSLRSRPELSKAQGSHHRRCHTCPPMHTSSFKLLGEEEPPGLESVRSTTSTGSSLASVRRSLSDSSFFISEGGSSIRSSSIRDTFSWDKADSGHAEGCCIEFPATRPVSPPVEDNQSMLQRFIGSSQWAQTLALLEKDPSLGHSSYNMICQGERTRCSLLHLLCGRPSNAPPTPVQVIEMVVSINPASLLRPEEKGSRLPLHMAILKNHKLESIPIIRYLIQAQPRALNTPDEEGQYALHYAMLYGTPEMIRMIGQANPAAYRLANTTQQRYPLHLLMARRTGWSAESEDWQPETNVLTRADVEQACQAHPDALLAVDRYGRTPLHLAVQDLRLDGCPGWDHVDALVEQAPQALLMRDHYAKTPLQSAKQAASCHRNNLLHQLAAKTRREFRNQHPRWPSFVSRLVFVPVLGSCGKKKRRRTWVSYYQ